MRRSLIAFPLVLFGAFAAARAGDEPKTYDLHTWRELWKEGASATVQGEDVSTARLSQTGMNRQTGKEQTSTSQPETKDTFTYVSRCLEADADGHATKMVVFVSAWEHVERDAADAKAPEAKPDTSAKGLHLEVVRREEAHDYRILTAGATPSAAAKQWFDKQFGRQAKSDGRPDFDRMGRPKGPVKVGDAWTGDPKKLEFPFPIDEGASSVTVSLAEVKDGRMRLPIEMRLKATSFPLGATGLAAPFTEGGVLDSKGTMVRSLEPYTFEFESHATGTFGGTAALEGVVRIQLEMTFRSEVRAATGGDMPAPPAEKSAEKPAEPAVAPK